MKQIEMIYIIKMFLTKYFTIVHKYSKLVIGYLHNNKFRDKPSIRVHLHNIPSWLSHIGPFHDPNQAN